MADNNTSTPSNPFQGATFNTNAINALGSKANQALPNLNGLAGVLPYKQPGTWTALGNPPNQRENSSLAAARLTCRLTPSGEAGAMDAALWSSVAPAPWWPHRPAKRAGPTR